MAHSEQISLHSLPPEVWLREMQRLVASCLSEDQSHDDRAIRKAFYLCQLCPPPLHRLLSSPLSEDELERLLDEGAHETAAQSITGNRIIRLARSADTGEHIAIFQIEQENGLEFQARSAALAIIGAWAGFFTEMHISLAASGQATASGHHRDPPQGQS
jgi:hypothetical protein